MRIVISFGAMIIMLFSAGCGSQGGTLSLTVDSASTDAAANNANDGGVFIKPLVSLWTESNNYFKLDLRSVQIGQSSPVTVTAITGEMCSCTVLIQGGENSGTMAISSCSGNSMQCSSFNTAAGTNSTYSKTSSSILELCISSTNCMSLK